jgi:hypothetical protein
MIAREEVEIEVRRLMSLAFPRDVVVILIADYIVARLVPAICAAQQVAEAAPADGALVAKIREIVEMLEPMKPRGLAREIHERLRQLLEVGAAQLASVGRSSLTGA